MEYILIKLINNFFVNSLTCTRRRKPDRYDILSNHTHNALFLHAVYGHLVAGPTAEDQPNRDKWPVNSYTSHSLEVFAHKILPALSKHTPVAAYAGLRPATQFRDYQLATHADR